MRGSRSKIPRKVQETKAQECLFCGTKEGELREAVTMQVNKRINECAKTISDKKLLAKLSADVIAQELKYHPACLVALYNEERPYLKEKEQEKAQEHWKEAYPIAFSKLVTYISEMKNDSDSRDPLIFKLADLTTLYKQRLEQLSVESPDVHSTRLKDQLLFHIPKMQAHRKGRDVLLAFEDDVGSILSQSSKYCEAIHLAKAAEIIRRDMLHHKSIFSSTFHDTDLQRAVPPSLLQFVCMIEHGADIKSQIQHGASKSDLSISQLLQYNCFAIYKEGTDVHRQSKDRETPFAVYMGLYVFAKIRKRQIIEMLHEKWAQHIIRQSHRNLSTARRSS